MKQIPHIARFALPQLEQALGESPVVLLHGPRQSGKTTLAKICGVRSGHSYFTFDDPGVLQAAKSDPVGFLADLPERCILDEVQRIPELFSALKSVVDRDRQAGRFLLTGSANILLIPRLSDSLAGRMEILRLHPLSQTELKGRPSGFVEAVFSANIPKQDHPRLGKELAEILAAGGYPAALTRKSPARRLKWYLDYIESQVQRDVRDLSRVGSLESIPRLLEAVSNCTAQLLNVNELASPFQLSRPTIKEYIGLLERIFLVQRLNPWYSNRMSRLVKTPKVHLGDTGLVCALMGLSPEGLFEDRTTMGRVLETFVFQELSRQVSWRDEVFRFHHFRTRDGHEVDIVLQKGGRELVGIEVKLSSTVKATDFKGLMKLREAAGDSFRSGVLLYDGEKTLGFGKGLFAVPIQALWES